MAGSTEFELEGSRGRLVVHSWPNPKADAIALIAHGYGEHIGRYGYLADRLVAAGFVVYGPDHQGHGRSQGERALIVEGEELTADLHRAANLARGEHPGLPMVLIGHSMGGLIATRYAQKHGDELTALVLSGPVIGGNPAIEALAGMDPMPDVPIDPSILSRDLSVGEAYLADPLVYHGGFKRPTVEALIAGVEAVSEGPSLGDLPTLWIHGEDDQLVPLDSTMDAFDEIRGPRSESKVYPGARHEVFNETNREEVVSDVLDFLGAALRGPEMSVSR
jgi:alpha-beta hydrolase superfamily lysophospholipase